MLELPCAETYVKLTSFEFLFYKKLQSWEESNLKQRFDMIQVQNVKYICDKTKEIML